jgi:transcriptional regulator with XRE-family HTH domain
MGYGGKIEEQQRARRLRAESWTLADIAAELGVAKSSVSRWVRDVDFVPNPRRTARNRPPNKLQRAKADEIERLKVEGRARIGRLSEREFLVAGLGLYAGDGAKTGSMVQFSNSNPTIISFFCAWLRRFLSPDESALRVRLYLHDDLDLDAAEEFWSECCRVPRSQFHRAHRPQAKATIRTNRHSYGCCHVRYSSAHDLRRILGLMEAVLLIASPLDLPG